MLRARIEKRFRRMSTVTGKGARIYPDDGHCAFKYFEEWAPESFRWLREKLTTA